MIKFSRLREFSLHFNSDYQELNTGIVIQYLILRDPTFETILTM